MKYYFFFDIFKKIGVSNIINLFFFFFFFFFFFKKTIVLIFIFLKLFIFSFVFSFQYYLSNIPYLRNKIKENKRKYINNILYYLPKKKNVLIKIIL